MHNNRWSQIKVINHRAKRGSYRILLSCRACGSKSLVKFLSLGYMPKPNGFLSQQQLTDDELYYPLDVCFCKSCGLVQLKQIVQKNRLFRQYVYITSASEPMIRHLDKFTNSLFRRFPLLKGGFAIDIGSNDGTLLGIFKKLGCKVVGIDPAQNITKYANEAGLETWPEYFNIKTAKRVLNKFGKAKIITAFNVVAHIDNWKSFFSGLQLLLHSDGVIILEFPYLIDLLEKSEFDTIYHEHLSYISMTPLKLVFDQYGFVILGIEHQKIHGGSLRIFLGHKSNINKDNPIINNYLSIEKRVGINHKKTYDNFVRNVFRVRRDLIFFLKKAMKKKKKVVGYCASAKGNILLNFCGITRDMLPLIADSTPDKVGLYTPGTRIPVVEESKLLDTPADYVLILAWNYADFVIRKYSHLKGNRPKFIVPVPRIKLY